MARKLAAVRSLHDHLVRIGERAAESSRAPAEPQARSRLPRVLGPDEIAALLDRIPAAGPLELRDRALFELAYACGLRAEEIVKLDLDAPDFDSEALRVTGKGAKTRIVPMGEPAQRAWSAIWQRPARRSRVNRERARPVPLAARAQAVSVRRSPPAGALGARGGRRGPRFPAHAAALVRHPSARGRRRPALDPGAPGHSSVSTTQVYTRVEPQRLRAEYARSHPRA